MLSDIENKRRPSRSTQRYEVRRTRKGRGLFACRHFRTEEIIGEIEGETITIANYESRYCFDLENDSCLEPAPPFRFVNHSCEPNCIFRVLDVRAGQGVERRLFLIARNEIKPKHELTIDYNWPASWAIPCRCGEVSCRGWIVADKELHLVAV